jgi:chemotaxis signal transduction protein
VTGLVTFRLGQREYATPLGAVREVVRLQGLTDLPGMRAPLAGVLDLRGVALPVLDLRPDAAPGARGDVLVLEPDGRDAVPGLGDERSVGVAVDEVRAVVEAAELPPAGAGAQEGLLPDYVLEVLRGPAGVVFRVDLVRMADSARAGRSAPDHPGQE